jgi:hypothetical protein
MFNIKAKGAKLSRYWYNSSLFVSDIAFLGMAWDIFLIHFTGWSDSNIALIQPHLWILHNIR